MYFEKVVTESEQEIINKINSLSDRWTLHCRGLKCKPLALVGPKCQ